MKPSRDERAKAAKVFLHRKLPSILRSNARARKGVESAELIVDPPRVSPERDAVKTTCTSKAPSRRTDHNDSESASASASASATAQPTPLTTKAIRIWALDTLDAARLSASNSARVAVLNMASPLRPGGGVLSGATSQEEWLCSRTTLYPSLREEFYRLPEVGAVYTPDVLVCKMWDAGASDLASTDQFFVDVVTAAMLRLPDVERNQDGEMAYSEQKDQDMVLRKMRCVMRILTSRRVNRVVLGAWGCGAYGNPVEEVARAWRRVLLGPKAKKIGTSEVYDDVEIVFAIKDQAMTRHFAEAFGPEALFDEGVGDGVTNRMPT
ncbi:hypothetical protein V8C37DRAFT_78003 [Trichoderma ceciliae]